MFLRRIWLLILGFSLGFYACQKEDKAAKSPDPNPSGTPVTNLDQATLLQLVNDTRQSGCTCGSTVMPPVAAVTWNDQLATAALNHGNDMYTENYFSHTGSNGSSAGERITATGYTWKAYGENIAKGHPTEKAVIEGWLNSEGHCKNIMSPLFKEMGAARVGSYWTQEFGSR